MRIPRIYHDAELVEGEIIDLEQSASLHVGKVLRLQAGAPLILFNGKGFSFHASLASFTGKIARASILDKFIEETESPLQIHLGLGISKGDRMDYAIQKAVEVGVTRITPLVTERTVVRLDEKRSEKRLAHWQGIIINACEQSGRSILPCLEPVILLDSWLGHSSPCKLVFDTETGQKLSQLERVGEVSILIGPEGGLAENEIKQAVSENFTTITLGPRILRTETAVVSACSSLQVLWGDYT